MGRGRAAARDSLCRLQLVIGGRQFVSDHSGQLLTGEREAARGGGNPHAPPLADTERRAQRKRSPPRARFCEGAARRRARSCNRQARGGLGSRTPSPGVTTMMIASSPVEMTMIVYVNEGQGRERGLGSRPSLGSFPRPFPRRRPFLFGLFLFPFLFFVGPTPFRRCPPAPSKAPSRSAGVPRRSPRAASEHARGGGMCQRSDGQSSERCSHLRRERACR